MAITKRNRKTGQVAFAYGSSSFQVVNGKIVSIRQQAHKDASTETKHTPRS